MSSQPRFAISIPQFVADGAFDPFAFRTYLERTEALGFDGAWTLEQTLGTTPVLGPLETLAYAAACTSRLRLGCAVFVTPLHSPVQLAKSLATLDQLSRGRLDVGVATGANPGRPFGAFGVDPSEMVPRFTEGLAVMKALWTSPQATVAGRFWQLDGVSLQPGPFQRPHPPLWFGANQPAALRRAVRLGDGFIGAGSTATARFAEQVRLVRQALAEAGRDPATFRIAKRIYIAVDDDADRARQQVLDGLHRLYGPFGLTLGDVPVFGPPAACAAGLRAAVEAGAELILLTPFAGAAEQMERLAAEVVPTLAELAPAARLSRAG